MALSDEELKRIAEGKDETMTPVMRRERMELARELLAIRERQASAYAGAAPDAFTDAMERAVLGLPPPAPQRLYSEEELRLTALEVELCAPWQSERARDGFKSGWQETMRRLRGEGEAKHEDSAPAGRGCDCTGAPHRLEPGCPVIGREP